MPGSSSLPVKTIGDLVKLARAKPGAIDYSSAGAGTSTFLGAELFKAMAGINIVEISYRGGGAAQTAVLSGEVSVYFAPVATALPYVREGRLRGLAVGSAARIPMLPEFPTVAESGYPGYESSNWHGFAAPAKTASWWMWSSLACQSLWTGRLSPRSRSTTISRS